MYLKINRFWETEKTS